MTDRSNINQTAKFASGLNVVLGLWLIVAAWFLGYTGSQAMWNDMLVGIALVVLAGIKPSIQSVMYG